MHVWLPKTNGVWTTTFSIREVSLRPDGGHHEDFLAYCRSKSKLVNFFTVSIRRTIIIVVELEKSLNMPRRGVVDHFCGPKKSMEGFQVYEKDPLVHLSVKPHFFPLFR